MLTRTAADGQRLMATPALPLVPLSEGDTTLDSPPFPNLLKMHTHHELGGMVDAVPSGVQSIQEAWREYRANGSAASEAVRRLAP